MSRSTFDMAGELAYVTGGHGLIGKAICRALANAGATVIALERAGATPPSDMPQSVRTASFDAAEPAEVDQSLAELERVYGPAKVWINAAYPRTADWGQSRQTNLEVAQWRSNVDMQLNAACMISAAVCKAMAARDGGALVNIASIYGVVGPDFSIYEGLPMTMPPAYAAIKGGLIAYTRYLAAYYGGQNVRANAICPGGVANNQPAAFVANYSARTPLGRLAQPDEVAWPVVFLASRAAAYITGAALMVDGGWTAI